MEGKATAGEERTSRFENLRVWRGARDLCVEVYQVTGQGDLSRDYGLRDQMQRAAVSVMSNIAEGYDRCSRAEFRHFLSIARGSAGELRSQLYLARELEYLSPEASVRLVSRCVAVTQMLSALRRTLG